MFVNVSVTHHMLIPLRKTATKYKFIFNLIRAKCFLLHNVAGIHALDCLCNSYIAKKKAAIYVFHKLLTCPLPKLG